MPKYANSFSYYLSFYNYLHSISRGIFFWQHDRNLSEQISWSARIYSKKCKINGTVQQSTRTSFQFIDHYCFFTLSHVIAILPWIAINLLHERIASCNWNTIILVKQCIKTARPIESKEYNTTKFVNFHSTSTDITCSYSREIPIQG